CHYEWGGSRDDEARQAYLRAARLGAHDVRSRMGLAWVCTRQKDYPGALARIAEGLALDPAGQYREPLLQKQTEVLARLAQPPPAGRPGAPAPATAADGMALAATAPALPSRAPEPPPELTKPPATAPTVRLCTW